MAQNKKVVIEFSVSGEQALDKIVQANKELQELEKTQKSLKAVIKQGTATDDQRREFEQLSVTIKNLNTVIKDNRKVIQDQQKAYKPIADSIKGLRVELKEYRNVYEGLSKTDRESEFGKGLLQNIKQTNDELKKLESNQGDNRRNVANYEESIQNAIRGLQPMRSTLRDLREQIQLLNYQLDNQDDILGRQRSVVEAARQEFGELSQEYKDAAVELNRLEQSYENMSTQLADMTAAAGQIQDAMDKTSGSIKSLGDGEKELKAVAASGQLLLDSYTVLQSSMVALGIESEELINIFAKLQILQQGLNAILSISAALQEESILRQTISNTLNKIRNAYTEEYSKALAKQNIQQAASNKAVKAETAATVASTAAKKTATKASVSLSASIRGIGAAIKAVPVIGWITAAVAAIGTLTAGIIKHKREEAELNRLAKQRASAYQDMLEISKNVNDDFNKSAVLLRSNIELLKRASIGTDAWNKAANEVSRELGVTNQWLVDNLELVDELAKSYLLMSKAEKVFDSTTGKLAEVEAFKASLQTPSGSTFPAQLEQIRNLKPSERGEALEEWLGIYGSTQVPKGLSIYGETAVEALEKMLHEFQGATSYGKEGWEKNIKRILDVISKEVDKKLNDLNNTTNRAMNELIDAQNNYFSRVPKETTTDTGKGTGKDTGVTVTEVDTTVKDFVEIFFSKMKEAIESDDPFESVKKELQELITSAEKLEDKNLGTSLSKTFKTALENVDKFAENQSKNILPQISIDDKLYADYYTDVTKIITDSQAEIIWAEVGKLLLNDTRAIEKIANEIGISAESIKKKLVGADTTLSETTTETEKQLVERTREYIRTKYELKEAAEDLKQLDSDEKQAQEIYTVNEQYYNKEIQSEEEYQRQLLAIQLKYAKLRVEALQTEILNMQNLTEEEKIAIYGSNDAFAEASIQKSMELIGIKENILDINKQIADSELVATEAMKEAYSELTNSIIGVIGNSAALFNSLAENNEKYQKYATALTIAQITFSTAASLGEAVKGASAAAAAGGPLAPILLPMYILTMIGTVLGGITQAVQTLNQAKSQSPSAPRFAEGGLVGVPGVYDSSDTINAKLSNGEYVIKSSTVKRLGVDVLDMVNNGGLPVLVNNRGVSVEEIKEIVKTTVENLPAPEVSVREISKKQNRVKIKEK